MLMTIFQLSRYSIELVLDFRYDPKLNSYNDDMNAEGILIMATDNLPTELAKEVNLYWHNSFLHRFLHDSCIYGRQSFTSS